MTALTYAFNALSVAALVALVYLVATGVIDLARECWSPEVGEPRVHVRVVAPPFDYERDG